MKVSHKIITLVLFGLFTAPFTGFCQTEALKVVVNNLAYYKQHSELKYLANAKKSVDSLIKTRSDSSNLSKNIYKAIVYSSIAYIDSANKLNQPADFDKTVALVNRLSKHKKIYKYQTELAYSRRCLANVFIRNGFDQIKKLDFDAAVTSFQNAQTYAPNFGQINAYIAYANTRAGHLPEAVKIYNTLLTADSARAEYVIAASNIYKTMGDTSKALDVLQKGRKLIPGEKSFLLEEANIYNNKKDYKSLEPLLKSLLDAYTNNAEVFFIAANCYDHLNQLDRAESLYLRSVELNASGYDQVYNLGLLYLKRSTSIKNYAEAEKNRLRSAQWLQKAYEMAPKNVNTLKLLQFIYAKTGNEVQLNNINTKLQQLTN